MPFVVKSYAYSSTNIGYSRCFNRHSQSNGLTSVCEFFHFVLYISLFSSVECTSLTELDHSK